MRIHSQLTLNRNRDVDFVIYMKYNDENWYRTYIMIQYVNRFVIKIEFVISSFSKNFISFLISKKSKIVVIFVFLNSRDIVKIVESIVDVNREMKIVDEILIDCANVKKKLLIDLSTNELMNFRKKYFDDFEKIFYKILNTNKMLNVNKMLRMFKIAQIVIINKIDDTTHVLWFFDFKHKYNMNFDFKHFERFVNDATRFETFQIDMINWFVETKSLKNLKNLNFDVVDDDDRFEIFWNFQNNFNQ